MLGVSYDTIIHKLAEQVEHAKRTKENPQLFKQHISQIHLLCELIMNETNSDYPTEHTPPLAKSSARPSAAKKPLPTNQSVEEADLKGDSIFDF